MRHIKKLMGMRNKETYARIYTGIYRIYAHIDIRIYVKYTGIIHVCIVHIYLSCTEFIVLLK